VGVFRRGRAEPRLDPMPRRLARGTLIRLAAVAALLGTAAALIWSRPSGCAPATVASQRPAVSSSTRTSTPPVGVPRGNVGVPVRLAEPTALSLVHAGDRVDLLSVGEGDSRPVASAALVLKVTDADDPATGGLLLALTPDEARLAVASPGRGFAVLIRPG
jgi:hypothetical protein